jgi:predicted metal-dependent phosphotriesterase family hydrolase
MGLTADQWRFISERLVRGSDKEAAASINVPVQTVYNWKCNDAEFAHQYEAAFADGVHVAIEITRQNLGRAAQTLTQGLDATKLVDLEVIGSGEKGRQFVEREVPDWKARLEAVKILFQSHGLLKDKVDVNNTGKLTIEVVRVAGRTKSED